MFSLQIEQEFLPVRLVNVFVALREGYIVADQIVIILFLLADLSCIIERIPFRKAFDHLKDECKVGFPHIHMLITVRPPLLFNEECLSPVLAVCLFPIEGNFNEVLVYFSVHLFQHPELCTEEQIFVVPQRKQLRHQRLIFGLEDPN